MFGHFNIFVPPVRAQAQAIVNFLAQKIGVQAPLISLYDDSESKRAAYYELGVIFIPWSFELDSDGIYVLLHEFAHHLDQRKELPESKHHDERFCELLYLLLQNWKQHLIAHADYFDVMVTIESMYKYYGKKCKVHYDR